MTTVLLALQPVSDGRVWGCCRGDPYKGRLTWLNQTLHSTYFCSRHFLSKYPRISKLLQNQVHKNTRATLSSWRFSGMVSVWHTRVCPVGLDPALTSDGGRRCRKDICLAMFYVSNNAALVHVWCGATFCFLNSVSAPGHCSPWLFAPLYNLMRTVHLCRCGYKYSPSLPQTPLNPTQLCLWKPNRHCQLSFHVTLHMTKWWVDRSPEWMNFSSSFSFSGRR